MVFSGTPEYRGFELVTEKTAFCVGRSQKTNVRKHNPKPSIILIYNAVTELPPPWGRAGVGACESWVTVGVRGTPSPQNPPVKKKMLCKMLKRLYFYRLFKPDPIKKPPYSRNYIYPFSFCYSTTKILFYEYTFYDR